MKLNRYIDHTNLKPDATEEQIDQLCNEAAEYHFASVCINPYWVNFCVNKLADTDVKVCTVIGFPLGATSITAKVDETKQAIKDGADELDMVINIGELKAGHYEAVENDIKEVATAVHEKDKVLKVIIETCLLTDDEKIKACQLCEKADADFVKTSTGFSTKGATVHDVALMRKTVGNRLKVKAAGGIHTKEEALSMIEAGADRIGASSGVKIMNS